MSTAPDRRHVPVAGKSTLKFNLVSHHPTLLFTAIIYYVLSLLFTVISANKLGKFK
jgi:hypothetical protein